MGVVVILVDDPQADEGDPAGHGEETAVSEPVFETDDRMAEDQP